jgi:hypothetical protein
MTPWVVSRARVQRAHGKRGTEGSNPSPSSGESSANLTKSAGSYLAEANAIRKALRQAVEQVVNAEEGYIGVGLVHAVQRCQID